MRGGRVVVDREDLFVSVGVLDHQLDSEGPNWRAGFVSCSRDPGEYLPHGTTERQIRYFP